MSGARRKPAARKAAAGRVIDLDKRRAARAETSREPVTLKIAGREFELPAEMPADFMLCAGDGELRESVIALMGDDGAKEFFALRPSVDDLTDLITVAGEVYGVDPGEAPASPAS